RSSSPYFVFIAVHVSSQCPLSLPLSLFSSLGAYTCVLYFFFTDTPPTEIYTLSLHDALPISNVRICRAGLARCSKSWWKQLLERSEEHTSELQSRFDLVCRLLLEKKKHKCIRRIHQRICMHLRHKCLTISTI